MSRWKAKKAAQDNVQKSIHFKGKRKHNRFGRNINCSTYTCYVVAEQAIRSLMLEEISSSWYRDALGSMTVPPGPGNAVLLCCTERASFLEAIGAKMHPFMF